MSSSSGRSEQGQSVVVVGLGYVGLPLALAVERAGHECVGIDHSEAVVASLSAGVSHVDDIADEELGVGRLEFTTAPERISSADVVVICVPTPLTYDLRPDLSAVESAVASISEFMGPGTLVILESTTYPGTTDGPVLDRLTTTGREVGRDFFLAFSPERIDPGNPTFGLENTPKVVGGVTESCAQRAAAFYATFVDDVVVVSGTREAEMAKLLENTYRHVNIALVNEMAVFSHELGIDLWESIRAAATKPFGFQPFYPGAGVGGHCIPIDPNYLSHSVRSLGYQFRFVELAQEISDRMPAYVVSRVQDLLNDAAASVKGARVLVLGLTYKAGIADVRETPARAVVRGLLKRGAEVSIHDPLVGALDIDDTQIEGVDDLDAALRECDICVVLQAHAEYLSDGRLAAARQIFDTTGRLSGQNVVRL